MERLELINELKSHIDSWLTRNPSRNLTGLARECGVSESCVRRLYNNNSVPQNDNLMKILMVLSGQSSIENLKNHFDSSSNVIRFLMTNYSFLESSKFVDQCQPLLSDEEHLQDYMSFVVYSMLSNRTPISRFDIKRMFGLMGEMTLNELLEKRLVSINDHNHLVPRTPNFRVSKDLVQKHLPKMAEMFFKADSDFNAYLLQSETVSKKGYALAMDAYESFMADLGQVIKDNPGEVPLVAGAFLDTLTLDQYFKGEGR